MKPKRGKKKRSRVRAGVVEVGEPSTAGATVETTDAEPDAGEADASPVDDARPDASAASEDGAPAEVAETPDSEDVAATSDSEDVAATSGSEDVPDDAGVAVHAAEPGDTGEDQVAVDGEAGDDAAGAGDVEPGEADEADPAATAAGLQDGEDTAGPNEGDGAGDGEAEGEGEGESEADSVAAGHARRKNILESLLFASDKPLTLKRMGELMHERQLVLVREALDALVADYRGRGIELCEVAGGWQFRTAPVNSQWVQQLVGGKPVRLSRAQLETLAIVAYRQPITRPESDEIRGVDSGGTLKVLLDRSLIRVLGKKEEPGRPLLYGTTKEFLTFFNLNDLRELPTLREYHELTEDSRRVVEARLGMGLDDLPGKGTIAIEADGESLADEVAADLGMATHDAGQVSEDQDADPGEREEWAPEASEEWAPEASDFTNPEVDESLPAGAGEEWAEERSEEWAPEASDFTNPEVDEAVAAGEGEAWVDEDRAAAEEDIVPAAEEDVVPAAEEGDPGSEAIDGLATGAGDDITLASGPASAPPASEEAPQRVSPEGSATREEG